MSVKIIDMNLLNNDADIIVQQVNCKGVMGAGIAKSIRNKYPEVYDIYRNAFYNGHLKLGNVTYIKVNRNKQIVANICAQEGYGRHGRYTDYDAFRTCLERLKNYADENNIKHIAFPKGIGCGLAGGNWDIVFDIINDIFEKTDINVEICHLQ